MVGGRFLLGLLQGSTHCSVTAGRLAAISRHHSSWMAHPVRTLFLVPETIVVGPKTPTAVTTGERLLTCKQKIDMTDLLVFSVNCESKVDRYTHPCEFSCGD